MTFYTNGNTRVRIDSQDNVVFEKATSRHQDWTTLKTAKSLSEMRSVLKQHYHNKAKRPEKYQDVVKRFDKFVLSVTVVSSRGESLAS